MRFDRYEGFSDRDSDPGARHDELDVEELASDPAELSRYALRRLHRMRDEPEDLDDFEDVAEAA